MENNNISKEIENTIMEDIKLVCFGIEMLNENDDEGILFYIKNSFKQVMHFHGINVNIYFNKDVTNAIKMMNEHLFIDWLCTDSQRSSHPKYRDMNDNYENHFSMLKLDAQITNKTYTKRLEKLLDM